MENKVFVLSVESTEGTEHTTLGVFSDRDIAARIVLTCIFEDGDTAISYADEGQLDEEIFITKKYKYKIEGFKIDEYF